MKSPYSRIIGVDLGKYGGIACVRNDLSVDFLSSMPIVDKKYDIATIQAILETYSANSILVIEDIYGTKNRGTNILPLAEAKGIFKSLAMINSIPCFFVTARQWKHQLNLTKQNLQPETIKEKKQRSVNLAQQLFPSQNLSLKNNGAAEALLIAYYGFKFLEM